MELRAFWQWMVMTFLGPVGAQCAVTGATVAEHLAGVASPEVLAGMLGLILQTAPHLDPKCGSISVCCESQRGRKGQ